MPSIWGILQLVPKFRIQQLQMHKCVFNIAVDPDANISVSSDRQFFARALEIIWNPRQCLLPDEQSCLYFVVVTQ